jgi:hypothetical protein
LDNIDEEEYQQVDKDTAEMSIFGDNLEGKKNQPDIKYQVD